MITKVTLPTRAPFDEQQAVLDGLKRVNFVFGPNGAGKTTISQFIAENADGSDSTGIEWEHGSP